MMTQTENGNKGLVFKDPHINYSNTKFVVVVQWWWVGKPYLGTTHVDQKLMMQEHKIYSFKEKSRKVKYDYQRMNKGLAQCWCPHVKI